MKKLFILSAVMVMGACAMFAGAKTPVVKGRVDFNGQNVALKAVKGPEGGSFKTITWGKEEKKKFSLTGETAQVTADKWLTDAFVFIPEADGVVTINLMSNWSKNKGNKNMNAHWVFYDKIVVEGAELTNGDFEELDSKGNPAGWGCKAANVVKAGKKPFSGKVMVKAWHNLRVRQNIKVIKGQQVTVIINAKMAEFEAGKE
ncbi:MAG: hypothetical protein L3J71_00185 [Victivallaceae bacterium]|nr:hypothetical protein [Victivallaceae bacterium]